MSSLGFQKKLHRIKTKPLWGAKHLKIHYQIKFYHILCNSLADMASLSMCNSLLLVLYVSSCKYLGFHILSNTEFSISVNEDLRGFFGSVNSILSSVRQPRENVMMQLLYSNCIPKLIYGAAVKDLNATEKQQYNVAVNNAIRRIFGFRLWQSIRQIREFYGFPSIEIMFANAKTRFYKKLSVHDNGILRFLSSIESYPVE